MAKQKYNEIDRSSESSSTSKTTTETENKSEIEVVNTSQEVTSSEVERNDALAALAKSIIANEIERKTPNKFSPPEVIPSMVKYIDVRNNYEQMPRGKQRVCKEEYLNTYTNTFMLHLANSLLSHVKNGVELSLESIPSHIRQDPQTLKNAVVAHEPEATFKDFDFHVLYLSRSCNNLIAAGLTQVYGLDSIVVHRIAEQDTKNKEVEFYKVVVQESELKQAFLHNIKHNKKLLTTALQKVVSSEHQFVNLFDLTNEYPIFLFSVYAVTNQLPIKSIPYHSWDENMEIDSSRPFHHVRYSKEAIEQFAQFMKENHKVKILKEKTKEKEIENENARS